MSPLGNALVAMMIVGAVFAGVSLWTGREREFGFLGVVMFVFAFALFVAIPFVDTIIRYWIP